MEQTEIQKIEKVIERGYVNGIHENQNRLDIDQGFHQNFQMVVLKDNALEKVNVDEWLQRIDQMKADNPKLWNGTTKATIEVLDTTGNAATAKIILYKGDTYFSTDYMMLYKIDSGWKIVTKIFTTS